jgi:hypothetical protein
LKSDRTSVPGLIALAVIAFTASFGAVTAARLS